MRDLEELLRDTLTDPRRRIDPSPAMYEEVQRTARARRHRHFAAASAAVVVVAVAVTTSVLAAQRPASRTTPPLATHPPTPTHSVDPLHGTTGTAVQLPGDKFAAVMGATATPTALYAFRTDIVKLDPTGTQILATAAGPAGTPTGIAIDGNRLWVWSQDTGSVRTYDTATLAPLDTLSSGAQIFDAIAVNGALVFTSTEGLMRLTVNGRDGLVTPVNADLGTGTYGLALDPGRHRILVGVTPPGTAPVNGFVGAKVVALDPTTGRVIASSPQTSLGKESIAVVGDQIWIAGYGDVDKPRIEHLDAETLQPIGSSEVGSQVGPGAVLWPGQKVLWVRNGGDEGLSCVDPKTGSILEHWDNVQGPVTSIAGHAYGVQGDLVRLNLNSTCSG